MIASMRDRLPPWLASADLAEAGLDDAALVAAAEADATGLIEVDDDGTVRWSDEAYRLHGRPRWRRVRSIDDVTRGLTSADAGRVTAAYLTLVVSDDLELLYTVTGETGQPLDVLLRGVRPGLAIVQRATYQPAAEPEQVEAEPEALLEEPVVEEPVVEEPVAEEPVAAEPEPVEAAAELRDPDADKAFRALFDASPSGLAELRDDGTFVRVNDAFCRLVGRTWDSLRDTVYEALIHHEDRASAFVSRTRREADGATAASEHRLLHSDGSVVWVRARTSPIAAPDGERLLVSLDNVTASRAREEQLKHDALHDALTGLPNRRLVLDRLERAVSRARRAGQHLAVFFIDVDDLKHVNDTHPWQHKAGDVLLTSIAVHMRAALRETDTLGRLAGDEFLVICEEVGDDVAVTDLADRLLEAACEPIQLGPQTVSPTVSIGLALSGIDEETAEELLSRADAAMYVAKSHGGGRVERADDLTAATQPDLVGALHRGELRMQYQPVVSVATGAVLGMTAVLRWAHPTLGMLPAHQVRTALDSAAVLPVVDWCIDRAINDVRTVAPSRVDHVSMWLPVPGRAVQATSTRDALRAAVLGADGAGTPDTAPSLVLDVHESDLATLVRRPSLRRQIQALTETGPVAVGVEHLSADVIPLGALQLLGAASASVDPELVLAAAENESGEALVRSLISGATALGVVTVATGISSAELLEEARRLGVHAVSGDLIGPAASLEVYSDLLHGEHVTLPGAPEVAVVRPFDDADYAPSRPPLAAVRAPEEENDYDLLAEALADDEQSDDVEDQQPVEDVVEAAPEETTGESAGDEPAEPARSSRLLLGDVVDLAEQVARELGVALPPPAPATASADEVIEPGRTQPRLPGLADLHAALGSPEVTRALPDRTDAPSEDDGDVAGTDDAVPADTAEAPQDDHGIPDDGPALNLRSSEPSDAGAPSSRQGPHIVVIEDSAEPAMPRDDAGPAVRGPEASADLRDEPVVDLRVRGTDGPHIVLRPAVRDSAPADGIGPTLHLRGLGGSDGGSIL